MSDQDLEAIVMEILESSRVKGALRTERVGQMGAGRREPIIARRRRRRSKRNPLRTSLRLIFLGLVILCAPLLFSVKESPPPESAIHGTIDSVTPDRILVV